MSEAQPRDGEDTRGRRAGVMEPMGADVVSIQTKPTRSAKPRRRHDFERTELEVSELFAEQHGARIRYCAQLGGWFVWRGTHWELDTCGRVAELVKHTARGLARDAASMDGQAAVTAFRAAKRVGSANGINAILALAKSDPKIVVEQKDFDRDPYLLNVLNGTLDLRKSEIRPHAPGDLITRVCPVAYDPDAPAPTFDRFLAEVQPNPEHRAFLARLFGYAAVGVVKEHVLGVLWGPGANGKSVLMDCVTRLLGTYAKPGPSSLIVASGGHEPHPTDVASCVGARLVPVHETKRGAALDASKVKLLTGGDELTARFCGKDFFRFTPTHTLVMLSNYKPRADATDAALWRRVLLVPFEVVIPPERRDRDLSDRINAEASGVLRWIVEGAAEWFRIGLAAPASILEQTAAYRSSEDSIGTFLEERTVTLPAAKVQASVIYDGFKRWCEEHGEHAVRANDFAAELEGRGFRRAVSAGRRYYVGIGLVAHDCDDRGGLQ